MTAVFLGQAASTLLEVDVPLKGGIYTPACLGEDYIDRVGEQGFKIETSIMSAWSCIYDNLSLELWHENGEHLRI